MGSRCGYSNVVGYDLEVEQLRVELLNCQMAELLNCQMAELLNC